uniref:Si:dkey-29p10.4 n=1 Tax=Labrus bergylta TaxID=56723 RepID=A0A3Q3M8V5_9LABR
MGASLDTPARCPLCNELTGEPVTLKCNHQFCQRCIGDLWSVTPNGPYHCPEWRCKTVYQTLPFQDSLTPNSSRRAKPRSTAGSSSNDDQNTFSSLLGRPSITSRLLGKRKASTPAPEQPDTKRSTVEAPREFRNDTETPSTSSSGETDVARSKKAVKEKPLEKNVSKLSPVFAKHPATAPGSPGWVGVLPKLESRNTGPVRCHYCPKTGYQSAVKTCLVCGASMCKEHLRPHLDSPVFQNHTLHQEINRIYCRQCAVCVCTVCTVIGSHRDHVCISIREAERELRGNLKEEIKQLQESEEEVKNKVSELTQKKETFKVVLSEARAGVQQQYGAIREALDQEEQSTLNCVSKEERRVIGGLEEKLGHLQSSLQSIQQGLHTLEGLADAKGDERIQDQAFIMEYCKVAQLIGSCVDQLGAPEEVDGARLNCLQRWTEKRLDTVVITLPGTDRDRYRLLYGTVPLLDADTAHPKLQLSDNNRKVMYSDAQQVFTEHEARFSSFPQVKVSVDEGRWKVGLCEGQIERKGQKDNSRLGFNSCSWCLACDRKKVEALHNKAAVPVDADELQRVGVFLDLEEGAVSFFNVTPGGRLALMHSFKHKFTEPLYPAFSVSKTSLAVCDLFQS